MIKEILFGATFCLTASIVAQTEVYNEDFQLGMPANYSIVDNDGLTVNAAVSDFSDAWILLADPDNNTDSIMGSTSFFEPTGEADRWLITAPITLGAFGNSLFWEARSHDPSFPDDYFVMISRTDTQLTSFTDTVSSILNELETWQLRSVDLSEYGLDNETIYVAFVNTTLDGFKFYIDDIRVEIEDPANLNELTNVQIISYPNPTDAFINVSGNTEFNSYKVISLSGQVLITSNTSKIDVNGLMPGQYFVVAKGIDSIARASFIKL